MAKILSKSGISTLQIVRPWHVTQSIDAFLGTDAYDITLSGSMTITGSVLLNGLSTTSQTNVLTYNTTTGQLFYTASSAVGGGSINTGSLGNTTVSGSLNVSGSTNLNGNTTVTGSFIVSGSTTLIGNTTVSGSITSTGGFTGSLNGTASYVNLAAGPNITINQSGITFEISSSGGGGGTPAGNNYDIQFKSASVFGATGSFRFNYDSQSLEQGFNNTSSGKFSRAFGENNLVTSLYGRAEGYGNKAIGGAGNIAQGAETNATGEYALTQGTFTGAHGLNSHAQGYYTVASGSASHTEGIFTSASSNAYGSHAEGSYTHTSSSFSHAEGSGSITMAEASHAEGVFTTTLGSGSHAEGTLTVAEGISSHAEGISTLAAGTSDHAEGYQTTASSVGWPAGGGAAAAAHAEGYNTIAYGIASHAEGYATLVSNSFSHAEGYGTIANGTASHAEGFLTTASGDYSHAAGYGTHATGSGIGQSVIGWFNEPVTGHGDFIIGNGTSDSSRSNLLHASGNLVAITGSLVVSGSSPTTVTFGNSLFWSNPSASLTFTGSMGVSGSMNVNGPITASIISASSYVGSITSAATASVVEVANILQNNYYELLISDDSSWASSPTTTTVNKNNKLSFNPNASHGWLRISGSDGSFSYIGNGQITASGDISSSGDVQGDSLTTNQYVKHNGDTDTFINFLDDEIRFEAGNLLLFDLHKKGSAPHEVTVNTGGNNVDFIIKDDDSISYLIADASTTNIGIGSGMTTPTATLHVSGAGDINVHVEGHITASGDISSSGNFYANRFTAAGYISTPLLTHASTPIEVNQHLSGSSTVTASFGHGSFHQATLTNTTLDDSLLITTTEDSSTAGPVVALKRNSSSPDDGDYLGQIKFLGENDADQQVLYAKITGKISDASDTTEDGIIEYAVKKDGSNVIVSRLTSTDLKLINGTGLEVNGNISTDGTASAAYFSGDGSNLTNLQRPITSSAVNFSASADNAGYYFRAGGNVTCSIQTNSDVSIPVGTEFEFFQTSSAGNLLFETGSASITLNSKSGNMKLAGQFSGATLKKVGTNEFDLIGDLG